MAVRVTACASLTRGVAIAVMLCKLQLLHDHVVNNLLLPVRLMLGTQDLPVYHTTGPQEYIALKLQFVLCTLGACHLQGVLYNIYSTHNGIS